MRKVLFIAVLVLGCGSWALAQDYSKAELFAGYQYTHVDTGSSGIDSSWPEGFDLSGTYYFMKNLGITGDFAYATKSFTGGTDAHLYGFNFGPQVKFRSGRLEPFAHVLFGATHGTVNETGVGSMSDTAFSMKLGGGLDVAVAHHFAVRLGEFDYYYTRFSANGNFSPNGNNSQNNFTFGAGIVIR